MGRACGWRKGCWDGGGRCTCGFDRQALTTTYIMDSTSIFWLHSSFDYSSTLWASPVWCCMKIEWDNEGREIQFGSQCPSGNSWETEKWWRVWLLQFGRPSSNHSVSGVFFTKVQTKQNNTHTHHNTTRQTRDSRTAGSVGWLWLKCEFACRRNGVSFANPLVCFSTAAQFWSNLDTHSKHLKVIVGSFLGSFGDLGDHIGVLGGHLGTVWDPYSNVKAFWSDSGKNRSPIWEPFWDHFSHGDRFWCHLWSAMLWLFYAHVVASPNGANMSLLRQLCRGQNVFKV